MDFEFDSAARRFSKDQQSRKEQAKEKVKFLLEDILVRNTDLSAQCGHAAELVERLTAAAAAEALGRRAEVLWSTSAANVFAEGNGGGRICFPFPPNVQGTRTCTSGAPSVRHPARRAL